MIHLIGFTAALLTTLAFIPQVYKVWRYNDTRSISLTMFVVFCTGVCLWLFYGILKNDTAIVAANVVTLLLAGYILVKKILNLPHEKIPT